MRRQPGCRRSCRPPPPAGRRAALAHLDALHPLGKVGLHLCQRLGGLRLHGRSRGACLVRHRGGCRSQTSRSDLRGRCAAACRGCVGRGHPSCPGARNQVLEACAARGRSKKEQFFSNVQERRNCSRSQRTFLGSKYRGAAEDIILNGLDNSSRRVCTPSKFGRCTIPPQKWAATHYIAAKLPHSCSPPQCFCSGWLTAPLCIAGPLRGTCRAFVRHVPACRSRPAPAASCAAARRGSPLGAAAAAASPAAVASRGAAEPQEPRAARGPPRAAAAAAAAERASALHLRRCAS